MDDDVLRDVPDGVWPTNENEGYGPRLHRSFSCCLARRNWRKKRKGGIGVRIFISAEFDGLETPLLFFYETINHGAKHDE
mmetsp:Transcript_27645/g.51864  ORF Transcript_27645/g.51864 Transcript_27645/m.51864 type:complete len:80 (-) Transcript_27645:132-371(-)